MKNNNPKNIETGLEIAITGMSGKFPGAGTLERFWENLKNGVETISFFSTEELKECGVSETLLDNPDYVKAYGVLIGKENFDSSFFGFSPREAEAMDPQIRLFLECSWEALEDAGYDSTAYKGAVGLYAGIADGFSWRAARMLKDLRAGVEQAVHLLDTSLLLSTRVSHKLDLKGPSITLYTACSTSLVAVHQACRSLLTGECDMALAGAVSAQPIDKTGYLYQEGMILSLDGHNRSFDARATGTVFGEGIGVVLLKRLKDALADGDNIKSVIKASAVNNDGIAKSSYTAPGKKRIADVMRTALKLARLAPGDIDYIEAHGTATALGDAIEMEALKEAFKSAKKAYCAIGSVKSNVGHLDVAAGMAGLIKTVLAIQRRLIPPSLYFETPNPKIDLIDSPFYVNTALTPWERGANPLTPLRAGVCSFGIGGTNAFILLEEPPVRPELAVVAATPAPAVPQLILFSARTESALETITRNLAEYFKNNPGVNLADAAYTLQVGRKTFSRRRMIICSNAAEAVEALAAGVDPLREEPSAPVELLRKAGTAWLESGTVDWPAQQKGRRISLPTYPFERQRYWIEDVGGDPLAALTGLSPAKAEKTAAKVAKEVPGLYLRPQLSAVYEPPSDEIEQVLTGIWQRFFGIREVGVLDDFFELGGDSLKVITVVAEIHKQMDARVPIPQVFDTPTIRGLAEYIKSRGVGVDKYAAVEPVEEKEYYPLSSVQKRIYILQQIEVGSTGYNTPLLFRLAGRVDRGRMESVFQSLVARHESLRTSFELINGEVVQRIRKEVEFKIEYYDLATDEHGQTRTLLKVLGSPETLFQKGFWPPEAIIKSFIRPFDVSCAPLLRVGLAEMGNDSYLFMVDMHHSITDGSSIGILIREFAALYAGETLPVLRIQYKDYTHWQNSDKQREAVKAQGAYWLGIFEGELPVLNLPTDYARPALQSFEGNRTQFEISREQAGALRSLALKEDVTLFMALLSLYNIMLAKICGQEDIVIGTPIAGRNHADLQGIIGMLVNTLALRNAPSGEKTFREFLKEVRKSTLAAFENRDYPFEDLVEQATRQINRDVSRNPIFDTIFNLLNFESQYENNVKIEVPGMTIRPYEYERGIAIFDLSLDAVESQDGITFTFEFCTKLFKPGTIDRFIGYFKKIVSAAAAAPDQKIAQLEILSEEEKQQILRDCTGPAVEFEGKPLIHDLFRRQAEKTPDHIALVGATAVETLRATSLQIQTQVQTQIQTQTQTQIQTQTQTQTQIQISYRQLNEQTDSLAHVLAEKGVLPDNIVAVKIERSIEMIIGIIGILKAGGAYLPIDPELPQERIDYMLKDSATKLLVTTNNKEGEKVRRWEGEKVLLEEISQSPKSSSYPLTFLPSYLLSPSNPIYLIYTSGSTGRPKGVMLEHRNVRNLLLYQRRYTPIDFSRVLQFTTISFDVSFQEIFSTLLAGGMLMLADREIIRDFPRLFEVIRRNVLKTLFLPASFLKFVFNLEEYAAIFPSCVEHIVTAGEQPIVTDSFRKYLKDHGVYFHNHYGPTETHVATALTMDPAGEIPALPSIGKPLANTQIYIVDKESHLLPVGIAGELLIGGVQVGRGYLNNPELTRGSFEKPPAGTDPTKLLFNCHSPFTTHHSPLYRTGDLAKWLPDGNIEFLGRIDFQVKIRGYRVELGEIESKLMAVDHVKEAVVIAGKDPKGETYLCAYIVPVNPQQGNKETLAGLRKSLAGVLPDYMTPSYFIYLDKIPLTPNGKVNRKALPEPVLGAGRNYFAPDGAIEKRLTELWSQVLDIENTTISGDANFFQLGGHSLKAAVLTAKIHKCFHVDIPLGDIFRHPTLSGMAKCIKRAGEEIFAAITPVEKKDYYPLSSAQKRLYIIQQLDPGSAAYNMPSAMIIKEEIDKQRLENTFRQLIRRHESFRTSFVTVNEEPVQRVHQDVEFEIAELGVRGQGSGVSRGDPPWSPELIKNFIRPFDLSKAPLLRVGLRKLGEEKYLMMVDMHHIISDGSSIRILTREFIRFYLGDTPAELPVQYKDFTCWQQSEIVRQKAIVQENHWIKRFSGDIPALALPFDYPRPEVQGFAGSNYAFEIEEKETAAINRLARQNEATLFMVLLAVFNVMLSRFSGQEDIIIGTPIAGRRHADLEPLIGMFVNTLALRLFPAGELTFAAFLEEVRTRTLEDFENQDCQFEDVVEKVAVSRDAGRSPLFDVMFGLHNIEELKPGDVPDDLGLKADGYDFERKVSRFDMAWNIFEKNGRLVFDIEYSTLLFKKATIARFSACFKKAAAEVTAFPGQRISGVDIIPEEERRRILEEFNTQWTAYPGHKTVHQLFAEQVERTPDHIALVGAALSVRPVGPVGPVGLSYRQLNEQADGLAVILLEKGVLADSIVGLKIERSIEMIIGVLGILKAGGAYLPIEPEFPQERSDYMLKDSAAKILLTANEIVSLSTECVFNFHHSSFIIHHSNQLAYIIYTSGTTGKPKGVLVEHRNVVNTVNWFVDMHKVGKDTRIIQLSDYTFDASVNQVFGTLIAGAGLYIAPKEIRTDLEKLRDYIIVHRINIINFVPSLLKELLCDVDKLGNLHTVISGAETLDERTKETLIGKGYRLVNQYGPTETTIDALVLECSSEKVSLGKPIANVKVYILDKYKKIVPIGVEGELHIAGAGVARGYLNRPELTADKFDQDLWDYKDDLDKKNKSFFGEFRGAVFSKKAPLVLYKTGDLTRWLPDGNIEFLGRFDHQVKIRGIRVELGEIENSLAKHKLVKEAFVIDRKDEGGETYLCAYIVPAGEGVADAELSEYLSAILPRNMIPAYFVPLAKIPLTNVGKIDRSALPEPMIKALEEQTGPVDIVEERLVETWSHVLSLEKEKISRDANFFALGGHSLRAAVLIAKIHKELDVKIPLAEIFRTPTVKGLAGYIRGAKEEAFYAVEAVEEREYYPLSSAQRRLYVLQQMAPDSLVYHIPIVVTLDMLIDKDRLEQMARQLIQRHESFRTSFQTVNEEPVQMVHQDMDFAVEYHNLSTDYTDYTDNKDDKIHHSSFMNTPNHFVRPFDLSCAPLLRVGAIKLAENKCILMVDMHHIISDGVSMDILIREFLVTFEGKRLPTLRIRYKDYAHWQNSAPVKEKIKAQEEFWLNELHGDIPILDLPFDYPRPQVQSFVGKYFRFTLDREETILLKKAALEQGVTMFIVLTAIYNILLYKLSGQEDIVMGTPIAGRRHADLQEIIGMFVNTLVLRNFPSGNKTFVEFLEEVKTRTLWAFENQDYQFEDLVEKVAVGRDPGRNPLFDVVFTWQELMDGTAAAPKPNEKIIDDIDENIPNLYEGRVARFDMTWFSSEENNRLTLGIEYCTKLFKPETIERFSNYFKKTVSHIIAAPGARIAEIDIVPGEEKHRLLYDFNCRETEYPCDKTIPQLFAEQAEKTADHIALVGATAVETLRATALRKQISNSQLNEQSDGLAVILLEKGALPGDIVGIMIERSIEMIIGLLGILKAGCAYLPINPGFPQERIDYMLKDSSAKILLTANDIVFNYHHSSFILNGRPRRGLHHSNLAYIIYTSGSTGNPKGVPITHANLSPLLHWGYRHLGINEKDRVIQNLSYYFDWSVWEIFITLTTGAGLFMISEELQLNPEKSVAFIRRHAVTVLHVTPTQYRYYLAAGQKLETLRYLFLGAETLSIELAKRSFESVNDRCRVFNMYGPTETTIIASVLEIERSGLGEYMGLSSIPIGGPVGNAQFLILDKHFNLRPVNVTGELYIGGGGLSAGYLNNPELTRGSFEKPPAGTDPAKLLFNYHLTLTTHHSPLYRTGDLARWLPCGSVEFLGRSDFQVKIRGYRIELREIENRLAEHPAVRESVVIARTDHTGDLYLCAYIVPALTVIPDTARLKEFLSRSLPDYMIPSYFVSIAYIPLNPNGKVDRRALPGPEIETGDKYEAPRSEIERKLVEIWSETLALDKGVIGIHDNFFERGGHSLKAAILVSRIRKEFCIAVPLVEVFKTPTVKGLGEYIGGNIKMAESEVPAVEDENLVLLRRQNPDAQDAGHLFLVHAGSGEVEGYIELCSRLNHRFNCWGLRVDRVDHVDRNNHFTPRDLGIPELAAKYIKAIKKVQPSGPYFILGWCIGGIIAFEMTRQLEQNGDKPGTLFLVNAYAPFRKHKEKTRTFNIPSELHFLKFLKTFPGDRQLKKKLENAVDIHQIWRQVVDYLEEKNPTIGALRQAVPSNIADAMPDAQNAGEFIYYVNIIRSLDLAREIYNPAGNGAHISKCNTGAHFFGAARSGVLNKNQWPDYFAKPVKFYELEGNHFSIFKIPDVIAFAEQFNRVSQQ
ncbi:MAG: amino acid adenylation domain-containing protein [Candidatus Aminicenantes bacterium]|nr:amino acid adenylation domain-containing protein [Candidatus Aminicenantes bacterium]